MLIQRYSWFSPLGLLISITATCHAFAAPHVDSAVEVLRQVRAGIVRVDVYILDDKNHMTGTSSGTGFLIDKAGHFVTNSHVIAGAGDRYRIQITLSNGIEQDAFLVARDELSDLAVLEVIRFRPIKDIGKPPQGSFAEDWSLTPLVFANPAAIEPGQDVLAIGFGLGLEGMPSVTRGIVSATDRFAPHPYTSGPEKGKSFILSNLVQTDAAINHGNSGGPLVNFRGEVVGVNTMSPPAEIDPDTVVKLKNDPAALTEYLIGMEPRGINYAISSELVKPIVGRMLFDRKLARAELGVKTVSVSRGQIKALQEEWIILTKGAIVIEVAAGSPAAAVGITSGDVIFQLGQKTIRNSGDLNNALALAYPGEKTTIAFRKNTLKQRQPPSLEEMQKMRPKSLAELAKDPDPDYKNVAITLK